MNLDEINTKISESTNEMSFSKDEYKEKVLIGHSRSTNIENYPYIHIWVFNEDGTYTNHLFSPLEMQRSSTRASNSPEICFELKIEGKE